MIRRRSGGVSEELAYLRNVQAWLSKVEYRPGWTLEIVPADFGPLVLRIEAWVPDSREPAKTVRVGSRASVPPYLGSEDEFLRWLAAALREREAHESAEWLRWRSSGAPVFDPHAEGRS